MNEKMQIFVIESMCKNNQKCVDFCQSDIIHVDPATDKAYNVELNPFGWNWNSG